MIRRVLISSAVLAVLTFQAAVGAHVTRVSAEDYWVHKILGGGVPGFVNEKETETEIRWESFGLEGQRFIYAVDKRLLLDTGAKRRGLLKYVKEVMAQLADVEKRLATFPGNLSYSGV